MKKIIKASLLLVLPFIAVSCGKGGNTSSSAPSSSLTTESITTTETVTTTTENIPPTDVNSEPTSSGPTEVSNLPFI